MFAADRLALNQPLSVAYVANGKRVVKVCPNAYEARRFYARKLKQGAAPSLALRSCKMTTNKKTAAKPAKQNAKPAKKVAKPANAPAKKAAATNGASGIERSADVKWTEKKVAVFKALAALGALSAAKAVSGADVAAKAKVTGQNVRHYCYHARAAGLTDVAKVAGVAGYAFHLTPKGAKVDPVAELKRAAATAKAPKAKPAPQ